MKRIPAILAAAMVTLASAHEGAVTVEAAPSLHPAALNTPAGRQSHIGSIFAELRTLHTMPFGQRYTLPARGEKVSGVGDDFLRRRTASEIAESGLSCGCGDYAVLFIERIRSLGYEALLIDSAQISLVSLQSNFAGHAIVAIRPKSESAATWWLVDTTARNVLSRDWPTTAKSFTASGQVYWIGYCGPLEDYPVRTPAELKRFYAGTLATVPTEVFNHTFTRLVFKIDRAFEDGAGGYLNPRIVRLAPAQEEIFARYHIEPERETVILLTPGGDDAQGDVKFINGQWVSRVGLRSACSPHFLTYLGQKIQTASLRP